MFSQVERKWSFGEYLSNGGCVKCGFSAAEELCSPRKLVVTGH